MSKRRDFVDGLKQTRSSCVCMTCQHFSYVCDQHAHVAYLWSSASSGPPWRALDEEVPQLDGPQEAEWVGARRWRDEEDG